jgi:hypothetical protein
MQCVSNPISQTHPQCLTSLSGRVQSFRKFDRPGCKARNHAFTGRIQLATVLNRTEPQRLFQTDRRLRTSNTAVTGCFQLRSLALSIDMVHPLLDRCVIARFRSLRDLGGHWIQVDVDTDREQGCFIEDCNTLEATFE